MSWRAGAWPANFARLDSDSVYEIHWVRLGYSEAFLHRGIFCNGVGLLCGSGDVMSSAPSFHPPAIQSQVNRDRRHTPR